jgi:organic radical activating enzyme
MDAVGCKNSWYSGEGVRVGTANVFVRFSGCNLACGVEPGERSPGGFACDTEFVSGRPVSAVEILAECERLWPEGRAGKSVIFTGGEPLLQLDRALVARFRATGWYTCIETNGTIDPTGLALSWITCSPKVAEHAVKCLRADEVKYVRGYGQGIPRPSCAATHLLISPAFDGGIVRRETFAWCQRLVLENPEWRLSVQQHKLWGIR